MPKHRQTLFAVIREHDSYGAMCDATLIGVYVTLERADEVRGASEQEFKDRLGKHAEEFMFSVQPVTFYLE